MDLQQFTTQLEGLCQLQRFQVSVSADLEIAALCRREFKQADGGKALLFKQVTGSDLPVIANLFGSEQRVAALLRTASIADFGRNLRSQLQAYQGTAAQRLQHLARQPDQVTESNPPLFTSHVTELTRLPAIRSWPGESGRYFTLALAVTRHPDTGATNLGLYRAQIRGENQLAVNFAPGSGAAEHLAAAEKINSALPICLFFGSDPALIWAAAAPLPEGCNEFQFCQSLFNPNLSFSECLSQPLVVPSDAELVIEGEILPHQRCIEGPFGNHTGSYVSREDCPLMQVSGISRRENALLPVTVVGPPPSENVQLARINQELIREMLRIDFPQISDLRMPVETIFHGAALLRVKPQSSKQNRELIEQLWRSSPLRRAKFLLLLDEDIDIANFAGCWWRAINQLSAERIYQEAGKTAIDATGVDPGLLISEDQQTIELLRRRSPDYNL